MTEQGIASTRPIAHRYEHDRERDWLPLERFAELSSQSGVEVFADDFMWMGAAEFADGRVVHSYNTSTGAGTSTSTLQDTPTSTAYR